MIPLVLRLENFMSYAELDLDLAGVHMAVLTGPNGAGKSSLLDAITYALWEKARAVPEQLIRLGQSEMWVELTFELEGRTYRVFRRRTRRAGVGSQLEFHQREGDAWVPLTGASTRETQARLLKTVRMDYDTFINSAFLRQGRADEFTTKTPQERKAVLAEILGLGAYDDLSIKARERWKAAQSSADALETEQESLRVELEAREPLEARLDEAREALAALAERLEAVEAEHARLVAEGEALRAAGDRRAALTAERERAEATRDQLSRELAAATGDLASAETALAERDAIEAAYAAWREAAEQVEALRARAEAHGGLERERAAEERRFEQAAHQAELAMQMLEADWAALEREADSHAAVLKDRERIERSQAVLVAAREAETRHMEKAQAVRALESRALELERQYQQAVLVAESARQDLAVRAARARREAEAAVALTEELARCEAKLKTLDIAAVEQDRAREKGIRYRARQAHLREAIDKAHAAAAAKSARLAGLVAAAPDRVVFLAPGAEDEGARTPVSAPGHAEEPGHAHCPMCESHLDRAGLERVAAQLRDEIRGFESEAVHLDHELADVEGLLDDARARFAELAAKLKGRDAEQRHWGELRARLILAEAAGAQADQLDAERDAVVAPPVPEALAEVRAEIAAVGYDPAELAVIQARIQDNRWAEARGWQLEQALTALKRLDERRTPLIARRAALESAWMAEQETHRGRLAEIDEAIAAHATDATAHTEAQSHLAALSGAPDAWADLQRQLVALAGAQARRAGLEAERAQTETALAAMAHEWAELEQALGRFDAWESERALTDRQLAELRGEERRRLEEVGRLEAERARLAELAERLGAREAAWRSAVADAAAFKELTAAFGRNGIQAILIENAIPEIEEDANRLLTRMTDNRMHVRLATQKEKKTGGVHETLEISISDEVGTRPYELYSGGEAFRVNFALRLALSRLLARRAGAKLQTLIIDEGFGTQDERGREKLVEAINAVSGEFARILVITHIRELKDAFNTHIEVVKRGGVSEIRAIA
jgi:exonuclease SbcC